MVIALRPVSSGAKRLITDGLARPVPHINGYLAGAPDVVIAREKAPLGQARPSMMFGSMPRAKDLVLSATERLHLIQEEPAAEKFIKPFFGAEDYIRGTERYCVWVEDSQAAEARQFRSLRARFKRITEQRKASAAGSTREFAERPWRFVQAAHKDTEAIIVPRVSSERREYVPIGYLSPDTVIADSAFAIYDAEPWVFALVTSRMHMAWLRAVGGKLESRYRYSNTLVYNTFPVPDLTAAQKETLTQRALRVLDVREYHSEKTLAELYDPDLMPANLQLAHKKLDDAVDALYRKSGFASDEDRLALLFDLYVQKTSAKESA